MSTAPTPSTPKAPRAPQNNFGLQKATNGGITLLSMEGTINEDFEGRKVAEGIKTKKLVVSMRGVRRFASWGMSEWMDFLRINANTDLYLVECSSYAVSQITMVTGLLGHAKLVSFYVSYLCGSCGEERETLFIVPRDREEIRDLLGSHQECATCGGRARPGDYPASFFESTCERPAFDIDDEVLKYLRSELKYEIAPDLTRFRAFRAVKDKYTYLRLSGSLALLRPELVVDASAGTTIVDLEGAIFDPVQIAPWRAYVKGALATVTGLQLINCPIGFLEHAVLPEDLHDKLKIRTFAIAYDCSRCDTTSAQLVDVATNLEQLVGGVAPPARCPTCSSKLIATLSPSQVSCLRSLPARDRDPALDAFLVKARTEPSDKLENLLTATKKPVKATAAVGGRAIYIALGLSALLIAGLVMLGIVLWERTANPPVVATTTNPTVTPEPPRPTINRPEWILSDVPSSAYCHDMINRLMCVGVSSYRPTRDEAVTDANDAALEQLVSAVGIKISDPFFRENVLGGYSDVRAKALAALQTADIDRSSATYAAANDTVNKARKRVVEILQRSAGAAAPTQRSDWYWEEYAGEKGKGNEVLVFVRYDVSLDALRALVDRYSTPTSTMGTVAMTAFPGLAWNHADFAGGAVLTKVGKQLTRAGIAPKQLVTAVNEQPVSDATGFARHLEDGLKGTGDLTLTVKAGDAPAAIVPIKR
ncbi:MAG: hypothetical protein H0T89_25095 [Deltaproteobacteria bacterium]|nr:hypothetical protein [Deltaproteobacteria bacterium]